MLLALVNILLLSQGAAAAAGNSPAVLPNNGHAIQEGSAFKIPLNETSSDDLMHKWLSQALSGLMAAVASRRLDQLDESDREELHQCSKAANSVPDHAKCVKKVMDNTIHTNVIPTTEAPASTTAAAAKRRRTNKKRRDPAKAALDKENVKDSDAEWVGGFGLARVKRDLEVINADSYKLRSGDDETAFAQVARQLTKTVRAIKNKEGNENWRHAISRVKDVAKEAKEQKKRAEEMKKRLRQMIDNTPTDLIDPSKPLIMKQIEESEHENSRKKAAAKEANQEVRLPLKAMRQAVKMALEMAGQNTTGFEKKTLKLGSPRFMSIMPEQEEDSLINVISPSLFSLHEDGEGIEKLTSLPRLLKSLDNRDQEAWMDFIVEASGVTDAVDKAQKEFKDQHDREMRAENGAPLYFTKKNVSDMSDHNEIRKIEVFEKLDKMYDAKQKADLDKQGYAMLSEEQLEIVYGKDSPYRKTSALKRFKQQRMMDQPIHELIEHDIRTLAEAEKFKVRRHDIVGSPVVLTWLTFAGPLLSQPVTLSPLVLSPITLSPAVLGPITLSPWVFIPLVLSPRVMGPLILSPMIFSPLILSPLVLHPLILSPGIFNPLVLTPLVLSPFILSPQVFTPLILSPMVLNPLILTPMVGSPLILSPFVLSPLILSPQALFAVVLSPYALSPLIESKLIAAEVVLSPSWLS